MPLRNAGMIAFMQQLAAVELYGYLCEDCTATIKVENGQKRTKCPYCGSENLYEVPGLATKQ